MDALGFELRSETLGALPVVNWFLERLGIEGTLERFVPHDDARLRLAPGVVIGVVLRNILVGHRPVYALGEWAEPFSDAVLGSKRVTPRLSTTIGWGACSTGSSTPIGPP
jgi:hypothetical protein